MLIHVELDGIGDRNVELGWLRTPGSCLGSFYNLSYSVVISKCRLWRAHLHHHIILLKAPLLTSP